MLEIGRELKGCLLIVLAASLWGLSGTVAKYLFNNAISPLLLAEIRLASSATILGLAIFLVNRRLFRIARQDLGYLIILGIFGVGGVQFAYLFTISQTNVATAVFLQYLAPVMVALYAVIFEKEKLGRIKLLALLLALGGSYLMVFVHGLKVTPLGLVTGLASAVFVSVYTIYSKRGLIVYSPWTLLFYCFVIGAVVGAIIMPPWRMPPNAFSLTNLLFFLYIAVFATIIPFGSYFLGLRHLQPTVAGITATLEPVVAAITAYLLLHEHLTPSQTAGAGLVLASVILVQVSARPKQAPAVLLKPKELKTLTK